MLGKLVAAVDVRDRLMRDADIGMFRYNPDDQTFTSPMRWCAAAARCRATSSSEIVKDLHQDDIENGCSRTATG